MRIEQSLYLFTVPTVVTCSHQQITHAGLVVKSSKPFPAVKYIVQLALLLKGTTHCKLLVLVDFLHGKSI